MNMGRAQASVELIAILGIALLAILFFAVFSSGLLFDLGVQQDTRDARDTVQALAEAADAVYAQGEGASKAVRITIPPGAYFGQNETYIGKPANAPAGAPQNRINIRVGDSDVFATTRAPVAGTLPPTAGTYLLNVTSQGSYVSVGAALVGASPSEVKLLMRRNDTESSPIAFSVLSNASIIVVNITPDWNFTSPALSVSPSLFTSNGLGSMVVLANFTTNSLVAGIYTGQLNVSAYYASDPARKESFIIPISVEIQLS